MKIEIHNIEVSDWQLIRELEQRIAGKAIFRAKNGKLWPKFCPCCGGTITEYGVEINYTPEELSVFNFKQWKYVTKDIKDKAGLHLPDLPFRETGRFYYVRCDNAVCEHDPCPVVNWDWFKDLDDARWDFFTKAQDTMEN